jgi:hypothetical protein
MGNDLKVTLSLVDDFTQKLTGIQTKMGAFGKQIDYINNIAGKFGLGFGIGIASTAVINGIKGMVDTAKQFDQVENQMRESLGYTSIELNTQAEELGKKNLIDKKDILTMQQRLSLYTQDEAQIKKLTPAILDYAKATGKTLLEATQVVTRAIESEKGTIRGFPGHLDGAAESTERLSAVMEILEKHFHGQAEAVRESKNDVDSFIYSANKLKETLAIGLFGKADEKELLRYKQALEYVDKYAEASESYRKINEDEYKDDLKLIQDYEKKIGDAKLTALKSQQEDAAEVAGKKLNLTPGFANEKDYTKDAKEKAKEAEREAKKAAEETQRVIEENNHAAAMEEIAQLKKDGQDYLADEKLLAKNEKKQEENRTKWLLDSRIESGKEIAEVNAKMIEDQKKHNEIMTGYAMQLGEKFGTDIGAGLAKGKIDMKQAMKDVLIMTVDFLEKEEIAAIAANTLHNVVTEGYWGLIVGAVEAAGISAIGEVAKGAINSFAVGTPYSPGGPAWINEKGPEMVNLPRGSQVQTAGQTAATGGGGSGGEVHIHIHDANGNILEAATQQLRSRQTADRFVSQVFAHAGKMGIN